MFSLIIFGSRCSHQRFHVSLIRVPLRCFASSQSVKLQSACNRLNTKRPSLRSKCSECSLSDQNPSDPVWQNCRPPSAAVNKFQKLRARTLKWHWHIPAFDGHRGAVLETSISVHIRARKLTGQVWTDSDKPGSDALSPQTTAVSEGKWQVRLGPYLSAWVKTQMCVCPRSNKYTNKHLSSLDDERSDERSRPPVWMLSVFNHTLTILHFTLGLARPRSHSICQNIAGQCLYEMAVLCYCLSSSFVVKYWDVSITPYVLIGQFIWKNESQSLFTHFCLNVKVLMRFEGVFVFRRFVM